MIVVSDTSAISNLLKIDAVDILRLTFGRVIIPDAVYEEICEIQSHSLTLNQLGWIDRVTLSHPPDERALLALDRGEAEAITLAIRLSADYLLIDEAEGRGVARQLGVKFVGLPGVLSMAKKNGHIERIKPYVDRLIHEARFRLRRDLVEETLRQAGE